MSAPNDRRRLGLALLGSLLLHAAWLLPAILSAVPRAGSEGGTANALVLTTRLPDPSQGVSPTPEAASGTDARAAPPAAKARPDARGYYSAEQLTQPPRPLGTVDLDIPEARLLTASGALVLTLWIDADGQVTSYRVDTPDLPEEYTTAVAEVFSATRFSPGELAGRKVSSILRVEVRHDATSIARP